MKIPTHNQNIWSNTDKIQSKLALMLEVKVLTQQSITSLQASILVLIGFCLVWTSNGSGRLVSGQSIFLTLTNYNYLKKPVCSHHIAQKIPILSGIYYPYLLWFVSGKLFSCLHPCSLVHPPPWGTSKWQFAQSSNHWHLIVSPTNFRVDAFVPKSKCTFHWELFSVQYTFVLQTTYS